MKTALCLGSFDGIHIGHRKVLSLPENYYKIAVTFRIPPKSFCKDDLALIMSLEDKCSALGELGIDEVELLDFEKVKNIPCDDFLNQLVKKFNPSLISCGFNYRFGKNAEGNTELLSAFCKKNGIIFNCVEPVLYDENVVSSTKIRGFLKNGEIERANNLLYKPFSYSASVIEGDKRGRSLGFPTINQKYPENLVKLKFGVYKTITYFNGRSYEAVTYIGKRPTFQTDYIISETFIKNFSGDLYGETVKITPVKFLRDEIKFSNANELQKQLEFDLEM